MKTWLIAGGVVVVGILVAGGIWLGSTLAAEQSQRDYTACLSELGFNPGDTLSQDYIDRKIVAAQYCLER